MFILISLHHSDYKNTFLPPQLTLFELFRFSLSRINIEHQALFHSKFLIAVQVNKLQHARRTTDV